MAHDPVKAHEYYINYRKKGLKKGRKKGKGTKAKTSTLLGSNAYGLNDEGKVQAALIREKIKKEMNEALKNAGSDEEKEKIRVEYSKKAMQQITALRSDPKYAKPKAAKKTTGNSKSSSSKSSSGSSRAKSSASGQKTETTTSTKKAPEVITPAALNEVTPETVTKIGEFAEKLKSMAKHLTPEQKASVQKTVQSLIDKLKAFKGALNG